MSHIFEELKDYHDTFHQHAKHKINILNEQFCTAFSNQTNEYVRQANISPIYKKGGGKALRENYRPI